MTKMQVGEESMSVRLIGSTVSEVENLVPWLLECKAKEKSIDVSITLIARV
jgi:D-serine ammonia-lyase